MTPPNKYLISDNEKKYSKIHRIWQKLITSEILNTFKRLFSGQKYTILHCKIDKVVNCYMGNISYILLQPSTSWMIDLVHVLHPPFWYLQTSNILWTNPSAPTKTIGFISYIQAPKCIFCKDNLSDKTRQNCLGHVLTIIKAIYPEADL